MVSRSDVIQQLNNAQLYGLPQFDNYYPIAARMSAYRGVRHSGLAIEVFEFNDSNYGHGCPRTKFYCFGDVFPQAPGWTGHTLHLTKDGPSGPLFDPEGSEQRISSSARDMAIRGKVIPVTTEPLKYAEAGIESQRSPENPRLRIAAASCATLPGTVFRDGVRVG